MVTCLRPIASEVCLDTFNTRYSQEIAGCILGLVSELIPMTKCNSERALRAIERLRGAHPEADSVAEHLAEAVAAAAVSETTLIQHSRWCNTGGSWSAGLDPARDAAYAMYGFVPDRLIERTGEITDESRRLLAEYVVRLRDR